MRITLLLEDDVAAQLETLRKSRGGSLKALVDEALRLGLAQMRRIADDRPVFQQKTNSLGGCLLPDVDDVVAVLEFSESDDLR